VDPASSKSKLSDYTAMIVWGLNEDGNYYVIDMVRDRLNLTERTKRLMDLCWKYRPILGVGYERYGLQADKEHIEQEMSRANRRFPIKELAGPLNKQDRIKKLIPKFEQGKVYLPHSFPYTDYEGKTHDLVQRFIKDEYLAFPVSQHEDMLDAMARILDDDLGAQFPIEANMGGIKRATQREIDDAYEGDFLVREGAYQELYDPRYS
jgi:predicted phage terminase large subunit-like protein